VYCRTTLQKLEVQILATPAFIPPDLWLPNSSDLNPVDKIRGIVQQRVYQSRVHNIDELKQRLLHVWHGIGQTIIDNAMAWTSSRMCAGKKRTLRATIMAKFSHMTKDVSVFVKCDTIFRLFFF